MSSAAHHTAEHRTRRALASAALAVKPARCPFCLELIYPWQAWDLDHETPVAWGGANGPVRPAHARCNRTHGGGIRTRRRAAPSRQW